MGDLNNESAEASLPLNHQQTAFSRSSSDWNYHINSTQGSVFPEYSLFKTIFWFEYSYHSGCKLCILGDLSNECRIFPSVIDKLPFQDHVMHGTIILSFNLCLQGELNNQCAVPILLQCHWQRGFSRLSSEKNYCINSKLSSGRPEQWMYRAKSFPVSPTNSHFKTIFQVQLQELDSTFVVNLRTHYHILTLRFKIHSCHCNISFLYW